MKPTKKILAVFIAVAMLAAMVVLPPAASAMTPAQRAATLNILRGDSAAGVDATFLAKNTNRSQGARVLLRLTGRELAADAFTGTATFTDATTATLFWRPMLAFLRANPNAGFQGFPDGTFRPNQIMTAQELYKVLLVALGYVENVDFTWGQVFSFAATKGLTALRNRVNVTNNDLAVAMMEALNATKKDGQMLISFLVQERVVTLANARAAGFNVVSSVEFASEYTAIIGQAPQLPARLNARLADGTVVEVSVTWSAVSTATLGIRTVTGTVAGFGTFTTTVNVTPDVLAITEAFPSGAREITVVVNRPVPQGTSVSLRIGNITQTATPTFDAARRVIKFTRTWHFAAGAYTAVVGDSTRNFTVETERMEQIAIGAGHVFPLANQNLGISLLNQYMEPMVLSNMAVHITNITRGTILTPIYTGTEVRVDATDHATVRPGDSLMIFVIHNPTASSAQKQIPVLERPVIRALTFGSIEIAGGRTRIEPNTLAHKVALHATDQYGNPYRVTPADLAAGGQIQTLSTNHGIVNPASFLIDGEGKLVFNAGGAGTAQITFIVGAAALATSFSVTVAAPRAITTLTLIPPAVMTVGQRADITIQAFDQFGSPIPAIGNFDFSRFWMVSSSPNVIPQNSFQYDSARGVLFVTPAGEGTSQVSFFYDGVQRGVLPVSVQAAPRPAFITAVSIPQAFQTTATRVLPLAAFTVRDQYNNPFSLTGTTFWIQLEVLGGSTLISLSGNRVDAGTSVTLTANPTTRGNAVMRATVFSPAGAVTTSVREIPVEVVLAADITSYTFEPVSTMFAGGAAQTAYHRTLVLNGTTAAGRSVQLAGTGGKPDAIDTIISSNTNFVLDQNTMRLHAIAAGTTNIQAFRIGAVVAAVTVTASAEAPRITTLSPISPTITLARNATYNTMTNIAAIDQYGVPVTDTANLRFFSDNSAVASVNETNGLISTTNAGGTAIISLIPTDGSRTTTFLVTIP